MGSDVKQGACSKRYASRLWMGGAAALLASTQVMAQSADPKPWQLNMGRGVTTSAQHAYDAHMLALWVCVVIGVLVFGAMAVAMFRFRKSRGVTAAQFTHNTTAEVIWTVVPIVILVLMAVPATQKLIAMYDTRDATMTVKVTGVQWMWKYEYMGEDVVLTSRLDRESDRLRLYELHSTDVKLLQECFFPTYYLSVMLAAPQLLEHSFGLLNPCSIF